MDKKELRTQILLGFHDQARMAASDSNVVYDALPVIIEACCEFLINISLYQRFTKSFEKMQKEKEVKHDSICFKKSEVLHQVSLFFDDNIDRISDEVIETLKKIDRNHKILDQINLN